MSSNIPLQASGVRFVSKAIPAYVVTLERSGGVALYVGMAFGAKVASGTGSTEEAKNLLAYPRIRIYYLDVPEKRLAMKDGYERIVIVT